MPTNATCDATWEDNVVVFCVWERPRGIIIGFGDSSLWIRKAWKQPANPTQLMPTVAHRQVKIVSRWQCIVLQTRRLEQKSVLWWLPYESRCARVPRRWRFLEACSPALTHSGGPGATLTVANGRLQTPCESTYPRGGSTQQRGPDCCPFSPPGSIQSP